MQNNDSNGTMIYEVNFSFVPLRKNMFFSKLDIDNLEYPYQPFIQILIQNLLNHPLTLVKGLIGYTQQDVSLTDLQTTKVASMNLQNSWMLFMCTEHHN